MFVGFVTLGSTIKFPVLFVNSSNLPTNSSVTPTYRVYGNAGLMDGGAGDLIENDFGLVLSATQASPIVISSTAHGLTTGMQVTIADVLGNTAANGTFQITVIDANHFSLNGTTGNAPYTSGGEWNVSGLYQVSIDATSGNGYAQSGYYDVLVIATIDGVANEQMHRFGVI